MYDEGREWSGHNESKAAQRALHPTILADAKQQWVTSHRGLREKIVYI